jgi:polyhydroxyalkanoate synthase
MNSDPFGIGSTLMRLGQAWLSHPQDMARAQQELLANAATLNFNALAHWTRGARVPMESAAHDDERFTDPAWHDNPGYSLLMQHYLAFTRTLERQVYDTPGAAKSDAHCAAFWLRQWMNALAPSNFLLSNPQALRKAWQTGGNSLVRGVTNLLEDLKAGDLRMVDSAPFELGKNVAATPGAVVFRSELFELIQYAPLRERVHALPLVIIPPWINKYYILDLNEKKSMVRYLLSEGFTVFMVSWKNPGPEMADSSYEEHVLDGALKAVEIACEIGESKQAHLVGYCIGGTAVATLMAWLNRKHRSAAQIPVPHWSLLASLTDFSKPGEVAHFINRQSLETIDALMEKQGYLDAGQIGWSFRMLRPNSLIWHYMVHKFLCGEKAPALDVLAWNVDSIRLPKNLHSFCLHELYVENKLVQKDAIVLRGVPIDLRRIRQPLYAAGAQEDHITPWRSTFAVCAMAQGPVRYTLSTSGHILGIVNPPGPHSKREYWSGDASGAADDKAWLAAQQKHAGSWWPDWSAWLHERCGPLRQAAAPGSARYPRLCDAPGTYVRG